jgi:hypothetical protein
MEILSRLADGPEALVAAAVQWRTPQYLLSGSTGFRPVEDFSVYQRSEY